MKIALVSKSDASGGGASSIAEDLAGRMIEERHGVRHFIGYHTRTQAEGRADFQELLAGKRDWHYRKCLEFQRRLSLPEVFPVEYALNFRKEVPNFDLVHFHDLASAVSPLTLWHTGRRSPTFFTVHDASAFTGGCLYPMECRRFLQGCGRCPQLGTWPINVKKDRTRLIFRIRKAVARHARVQFIFSCQWMLGEARKVFKFERPPVVIPNGVEERIFYARPREEMKKKLGLDPERPVILIAAYLLKDVRKGVRYAIDAVNAIRDLQPQVLLFGGGDPEIEAMLEDLPCLRMGWLKNREQVAECYSAADAFLFCTLADNHPLSLLESIGCGTPPVAFATGGVPEIIKDGENGFLVEPKNLLQLVQKLRICLQPDRSRALREFCTQDFASRFTLKRAVRDHEELYARSLEPAATRQPALELAPS